MILGREWLKQNGVRLYFDLGYLRIDKTYVRLEEDIHISSLLRLYQKTILKPQSVTVCSVKLNQGFDVANADLLEILPLDSGLLDEEPGIVVFRSLVKVDNSRKIPVMLINNTNKYFKFKRGEVVEKGECVKEQSVTALNLNKEKLEKYNSILDNLHVTPDKISQEKYRLICRKRR